MALKFPWDEIARKEALIDLFSHNTNSWHAARVLDVVGASGEVRCVYADGPARGKMLWVSVHHEQRVAKFGTRSEEEDMKLTPWKCADCSMENTGDKDACGMCYSKKLVETVAGIQCSKSTPEGFHPSSKSKQYCNTCRKEFNATVRMFRCDSCGTPVCKACCVFKEPSQISTGCKVPMCHTCNLSANCVLPRNGTERTRNRRRIRRASSNPDVSALMHMGIRKPRASLAKPRRQSTLPDAILASQLVQEIPMSATQTLNVKLPAKALVDGSGPMKSVKTLRDQETPQANDRTHEITNSVAQKLSDTTTSDASVDQASAGKSFSQTKSSKSENKKEKRGKKIHKNCEVDNADKRDVVDKRKLSDHVDQTFNKDSKTCVMPRSEKRDKNVRRAANDALAKLVLPPIAVGTAIPPVKKTTLDEQVFADKDNAIDRKDLKLSINDLRKEILTSRKKSNSQHDSSLRAVGHLNGAVLENRSSLMEELNSHRELMLMLCNKVDALKSQSSPLARDVPKNVDYYVRAFSRSITASARASRTAANQPIGDSLLQINNSHDFLKGIAVGTASGLVALFALWMGSAN